MPSTSHNRGPLRTSSTKPQTVNGLYERNGQLPVPYEGLEVPREPPRPPALPRGYGDHAVSLGFDFQIQGRFNIYRRIIYYAQWRSVQNRYTS
jgi:hypothetical protein